MSQILNTNPQPETAGTIDPATFIENEFRVSEVPAGSALLVGDVAVFKHRGKFLRLSG